MKAKRIIGIVLIALQVLAMIGSMAGSGSPIPSGGIFVLLGYFLPLIIGVALLVSASKAKKRPSGARFQADSSAHFESDFNGNRGPNGPTNYDR